MTDEAADHVARWVRPEIRALSAYHVPDASGLIKLDAMENPYGWPAELREEWAALARATAVNRYPDPRAQPLKDALRAAMNIPAAAGILLGNGSDEIIQTIALALAGPDRTVLTVEPGFVMYRMIATFAGMRYCGVPLRAADFALDLPALRAAIEAHRPAVVFLAQPNNPTGNCFDEAALFEVIEAVPGLVVVDEAYAPFTDASLLPRVGEWPNLLVMRTVSKMGLAGLRLGYLAGPAAWLDELDKVRLPYNVNVLTQRAAELALRHKAVLDAQTAAIRTERAVLHGALATLPGVTPYPSEANFILVRVPAGRAGALFAGLRERGVLVKNLHGGHPLLADCLRVTVGTPQENAAFLAAFAACLEGGTAGRG
ncbi:MAG: histidinol-phosphate transaminase [Gammaproteobacteria bacterium]|jgi:histidinol-phosphate aminotransferase|nr:histidinol-phosphate transaminase [Gammaproteobacteria bacterium]